VGQTATAQTCIAGSDGNTNKKITVGKTVFGFKKNDELIPKQINDKKIVFVFYYACLPGAAGTGA
jgi:hypothetical protein